MSLRSQLASALVCALACSFLGAGLSNCTVTPLGASDDGIAKARIQSPPGADMYDRECASCHGKHGEGLTTAPAVMGAGGLPTYPRDDSSSSSSTFATSAQIQGDATRVPGQSKRQPFRTAQDVYDYVSSRMPLPKSRAGTLKPEEYWAIVNYLLIANGGPVPAGGVTEANAKSVALR